MKLNDFYPLNFMRCEKRAKSSNFYFYSKYWNVVVDFIALLLTNALGNPENITHFLFFKSNKRVEQSVVKLLVEREPMLLHFIFKELVVQRFVSHRVEKGSVLLDN